jgi:predicted AlkP superfamily phosphohydrolase/phosphomutase
MAKKVLIIGLDGRTWRVFNRLFEDGTMLFFGRLVKNGSSGILEYTIPTITPMAWSSFHTGLGPEKHGIF